MSLPCSLFAATELLVPLGSSANTDWRAHFFKVRKWFFGVFFVFSICAAVQTYVFLEVPLTHPYRAIQGLLIMIIATGYFARKARTHIWLGATFVGAVTVGQLVFRFLPGPGQRQASLVKRLQPQTGIAAPLPGPAVGRVRSGPADGRSNLQNC